MNAAIEQGRLLKMSRIAALTLLASGLFAAVVFGDEIRRTSFAAPFIGTWAPASEPCDAKSKSRLAISQTQYSNANGNCRVLWIVETAGAQGSNYSVHAACADASGQNKTADLIMRRDGDRLLIGSAFSDLKPYRLCLQ